MPRVPADRSTPAVRGLLAGLSVDGQDWSRIGAVVNWASGRCRTLIPSFCPSNATLAGGSTYQYAFWLLPTYQAIDRLWALSMRSAGEVGLTVDGDSHTVSGSPAYDTATPGQVASPQVFIVQQASQSSAAVGASLTFDPAENLEVDQICMWEVPRVQLAANASELGVDTTILRPGQPILRSRFDQLFGASLDTSIGKRQLVNWSRPYRVDGSVNVNYVESFSSSSYADLWPASLPVLGRVIRRGDATKGIACRVFAWVTAGTGTLRVVSDENGNGTERTFTNTTPAWITASTVSIDAEDLSASDGLRSSTWDGINVEVKVTGGTAYVAAVSAYET